MHSDKIIEKYIDLIEKDPQKYKEDLEVTRKYLAGTNAYQFGRPLVFTYQPIFISQADVENFENISKMTLQIGSKVLDRYLEDAEYRKLFMYPKFVEDMILKDPGYSKIDFPMVRIDIFYEDEDNFKLCEINTDGSSGMNADNMLSKALLASKGLSKFKEDFSLSYFELFDTWVEASLDIYKEFNPDNQTPNVAILDFKESVTGPDFEDFKKAYERAGLDCKIVDIRDLTYQDGALYDGDFKIDLVYRRMVTFELIDKVHEAEAFIDAYMDGAMCVVGSMRTQIIHNKLFFKILFDDETRAFLTDEEIDFIDKHVPYTGILGHRDEDLDRLKEDKDSWIVKPMDNNVSTGVYTGRDLDQDTWEKKLEEDKGKDYIFQEFVDPYYNKFVNLDNEDMYVEDLSNMMGLFSYNHKFVGTYNRMGRINVIKDPGEYIIAPGILAIPRSMDDILPRINELTAISKDRDLSLDETLEQENLRKEYLRRFRAGFKDQLLNVKVLDEDGNDISPRKVKDQRKRR